MSEQGPEQKRRLPPVVIVGIIMAALCGISLYIRIALPYDQVFVDGSVWFRETDPYWHLRNIEILVRNFPHFNSFDPYILFPGGGIGLNRPFFDWLIAGAALLISPGTPSLHTIETVAAYMPAILGTLTLIPVYFIGKELFNRWVGVMSAALIAILPGEFMHRSLLSFADHHVAETLFSTVCLLFLIMAIKRARERELSFHHILSRDWSIITKPLVYALLSGIFLGIYLLSWQGGLLFVFILFACLVIGGIVDHLRHKSGDYLWIVGTPLFLVALLMILPVLGGDRLDTMYLIALPIAIAVPIVLRVISRLMAGRGLKPVYYPLALLVLLGIGLGALYAINSSVFSYMFGLFGIFGRSGAMLTVQEATPLLSPFGQFTLAVAWANFTTSFLIAFVSLAMLIYLAVKQEGTDKIVFLVWSIIMLMAVLGQRRFGYYFAVNAALLTGYFSWKMLDIAGLRKLLAAPKEVVGAVKKFKKREKRRSERARERAFMQPRGVWVRVIVVAIALFFLVFFPNIRAAETLAGSPNVIMTEGWYNSSLWLKDNTSEPFGDPDFYYELYPPRAEFEYPDSAYGVMSWWDYGYFIMQIGHRIPNANPGQANADKAGEFFIAQNESSAREIVERYGLGTEYVMIDYLMATPSKFYAMVDWADGDLSEFYEVYYLPSQDDGQFTYLFYPAYYNSIVVRLYNFDGEAVTPGAVLVISYVDREFQGEKYKEVTGSQSFSSYEAAQAYVASQVSGNYRIVSPDPFTSAVPLEELDTYELVHESEDTTTLAGRTFPTVKVFKYTGSDQP